MNRTTPAAAVRALATLVLSLPFLSACGAAGPGAAEAPNPPDAGADGERAPVHARMAVFVMARCPHCAALLKELLPLERELAGALELSLGYIGTVDDLGRPALAEGDAETAAAMLQVCAALRSTDREHLAFLECLYEGDRWRSLPRGYEECAEAAGLDPEELAECARDGEGREALELTVAAVAASGIDAAPTIVIEDRLYLGARTRRAMLAHICYLAGGEGTRPAACREVEPPPAVRATLLSDVRCTDPGICDVGREVGFLRMMVPTLEVVEIDYSAPEGRRIHARVAATGAPASLPLLVFEESLAAWPEVLERMERFLLPFGRGWLMPLGRGWDPAAEICDNGVDDTGDGLADCADPGCAGRLACRPERPRHLELFVMSHCPFAMAMMGSVDRFLDHFGRDRGAVDLELRFIGSVAEDGTLTSMHGQGEIDEDLRMACAQKLYPERYGFMRYVACRAAEYGSPDWEGCVPKGQSTARIRKCAEGPEGRALLAESFRAADAAAVTGSPTWIANGRHEMSGRTAAAIAAAFCERNPQAACERPVAAEPEGDGGKGDTCED